MEGTSTTTSGSKKKKATKEEEEPVPVEGDDYSRMSVQQLQELLDEMVAIEDYIKHPIPVTQYDTTALLEDLTVPKPRVRRRPGQARSGGRPNQNGPRNPRSRPR